MTWSGFFPIMAVGALIASLVRRSELSRAFAKEPALRCLVRQCSRPVNPILPLGRGWFWTKVRKVRRRAELGVVAVRSERFLW